MTHGRRVFFLAAGLALVCGLFLLIVIFGVGVLRRIARPAAGAPDFALTLQALIAAAPSSPGNLGPTGTPASDQPTGHIALTCQIYKHQSSEQICLINADGSGYRRLTTQDTAQHFYPSLAPDGNSVVYSQGGDIYETSLMTGVSSRLTNGLGQLDAPEISPDGKSIVFTREVTPNEYQIWVMGRDGAKPHLVFDGSGWDPTWSPDGTKILFASDLDGLPQLYIVDLDGSALHKLTTLPALRGRSDWSSQNLVVTYSGQPWQREIYIMNADGSNAHQISPPGGNSQGPSFSPDGRWIAFTAYFDRFNDVNGCEIYIMRTDGTDLRRLTNNDYCDYQPRWGP